MALRIRTGDEVTVISGRDKGARGKVIGVMPKEGKALVEGINLVKKHKRKKSEQDPGGIVEEPAPLPLGKLMLVDPETGNATRFQVGTDEKGKRVRVALESKKPIVASRD